MATILNVSFVVKNQQWQTAPFILHFFIRMHTRIGARLVVNLVGPKKSYITLQFLEKNPKKIIMFLYVCCSGLESSRHTLNTSTFI